MKNKILFIAEAGINHNGKLSIAKKMIDIASKNKLDFIKFQIYKTENLIIPNTPKANYQKKNFSSFKKSQYDMLKKFELSFEDHLSLIKYCKKKKIKYLASVFDMESLNFVQKYSNMLKIPSGEITNHYLLQNINRNKKVILSTGASSLKEVNKALNVLMRKGVKKKNIKLLHCNSDYPSKNIEDLNLNAIRLLKKKFKIEVGYSDHTLNSQAAVVSISLGATIIEKHFTLDKNMSAPDHLSSLTPSELKHFCNDLKNTKIMLGNKIKIPSKSEKKNLKFMRKSLYAKSDIIKGQIFTKNNLCCKRPAIGISAENFYKFLGKKSKFNFKKNSRIK